MRRRAVLACACVALAGLGPPRAARAAPGAVDIALVLAADVSRSIDPDEARLQREGYRSAVSDPEIVRAIRGGMLGAAALAYVEWSGVEYQRVVLPWARIASQADADAWAEALAKAPSNAVGQTSLWGAIDFSRRVLADCPWEATRRVVDVSGDGENNSGPPAGDARDRAVAEGITVNGLAIMNDRPAFGRSSGPLDRYYEENVIGGPGAFVVAAADFEAFGAAVKRKLIREIAGVPAGAASPS